MRAVPLHIGHSTALGGRAGNSADSQGYRSAPHAIATVSMCGVSRMSRSGNGSPSYSRNTPSDRKKDILPIVKLSGIAS